MISLSFRLKQFISRINFYRYFKIDGFRELSFFWQIENICFTISVLFFVKFPGSEEADRRNSDPNDDGRNYDDSHRYQDGGEYDHRSGGYQGNYNN